MRAAGQLKARSQCLARHRCRLWIARIHAVQQQGQRLQAATLTQTEEGILARCH